MSAPVDVKALRARAEANRKILVRTKRIVDRILPSKPVPHGFDDPQGFMQCALTRGWRIRLHLYLAARLKAKQQGGVPEIQLPKDSDHLFRPGTALYDISRYIEAQNGKR